MDHISTLLPKVLRKRGLHGHAQASLAVSRCQEWISGNLPHVAADLRAVQCKEGVLHIECAHSIAAQECQQRSSELLASLRESCGGMEITGVRLLRSRAESGSGA